MDTEVRGGLNPACGEVYQWYLLGIKTAGKACTETPLSTGEFPESPVGKANLEFPVKILATILKISYKYSLFATIRSSF